MATWQSLGLLEYFSGELTDLWSTPEASFMADQLAPRVRVESREGKLLEAKRDDDSPIEDRRAPGAPANQRNYDQQEGPSYTTSHRALRSRVTQEELWTADRKFQVDNAARTAQALVTDLRLARELRVMKVFRSLNAAGSYDNTLGYLADYTNMQTGVDSSVYWSVAATPILDHIDTAIGAFDTYAPTVPNAILIPRHLRSHIRKNTQWKAEYGDTADLQGRALGEQETVRGLTVYWYDCHYKSTTSNKANLLGNDVVITRIEPYVPGQYRGLAIQPVWADGPNLLDDDGVEQRAQGDLNVAIYADPEKSARALFVEAMAGWDTVMVPYTGGGWSYLFRGVIG